MQINCYVLLNLKQGETHWPLGEAEHELQRTQDAHQSLYQIPGHKDLQSRHCDEQSDQIGKANKRFRIISSLVYFCEGKS